MKTILCPTDFSPTSDNALRFAIGFSRKSNASLLLFHAQFPDHSAPGIMTTYSIPKPKREWDRINEKLNQECRKVGLNNPGVKCDYVLEEGLVVENIAEYTNNNNIDLLVTGTSGANGLEAIFGGSTSIQVMEKVNCPTLIIPKTAEYRDPKLFVYATDLLDEEDEVLNQVLKITQLFDAELELIHVKSEDTLELVKSEASMDQMVRKHIGENIRYKIIESKDSVNTIENYAKARADILVMAYHRRSFMEKFFSLNRVEKIAYHAVVPLLVMHKAGHRI